MTQHRPLLVAHVTAERGFSGGEAQLFLLMEGLRRRGHRGVLLCPAASASEAEARRRGIECRSIRARSAAPLRSYATVRRGLHRLAPDLVHLHSGRAAWLGGIAAWQLGLPALATRHMDRPLRRGWHTRFLYGVALRRAVAVSEAVRQRHLDGGVPAPRLRVVRCAVDAAALHLHRSPAETRAAEQLAPDEPCLLCAAALVPRKGLDVLLDALAALARDGLHPVLWLAGEGPARAALERRARSLGLGRRVRFLGRRDDVADLLAACDVFVLPSRREGLGVAALEAMALARPVVASRVGGLAEAVEDGRTGLLVGPGDTAALAAALARLLREPELRARLGAAGPARVAEDHSVSRLVESYEALYLEMLAEGAKA